MIIMDSRLEELFQRYMNDSASEAERNELAEKVVSGEYDEAVKTLIDRVEPRKRIQMMDAAQIASVRARIQERVAPSKASQLFRRYTWVFIPAAALMMIFLGWPLLEMIMVTSAPVSRPSQISEETIASQQLVTLPDGTTVVLNQHSRLTYPESFAGKVREVTLTGEGYFDVAHDASRPFIVKTGSIQTTVLGTAFNVQAYDTLADIVVTVTRGQVVVADTRQADKAPYDSLSRNEQLTVHTALRQAEKTALDAAEAIAWKAQLLIFDKVTMAEAARQISERFKVSLTIENDALKNCVVNGTFQQASGVEHVVRMLSMAVRAQYKIQGNKVTITGGNGCEAAQQSIP